MGRFSDVANAKPMTKLPWFPVNFAGTLRIIQCKCVKSNDKNTEFYIVEFEVLTSNQQETPPGCKRSWTQDRFKKHVGPNAVRLFIAAVLGVDGDNPDITEEVIAASVGDMDENGKPVPEGTGFQPFAGRTVDLVTVELKTRANTIFTKHIFGKGTAK